VREGAPGRQASRRPGTQAHGDRKEGRRPEVTFRVMAGGSCGSASPSEGEGQSRATELPRDQRQAERCRLLQRARPTLQPAVGASNDRGTTAAAAQDTLLTYSPV